MKTILVDDEPWSMKQFENVCSGIDAIELVGTFDSSLEAYEYAKGHRVEFALLDIEMPDMNGVELAEKLRELCPGVVIAFVTAHEEYFREFLRLRADCYVMKPYSMQDIENVLEKAILLSKRLKKRIFMHTFGRFDVFIDGTACDIRSRRAKELLALMVQKRGISLSPEEAMDTIWENDEFTNDSASVYRKTLSTLTQILSDLGIGEILLNMRHGRALDTTLFDCDYYDFLNGDPQAIRSFDGEYMNQYSWGEPVLAQLINMKKKYTGAQN